MGSRSESSAALEGVMRRRRAEQELDRDGGARYLLREKLLSLGDDFWIENDQGERIFRVDAKVLRVRDTVVIRTGTATSC